jgi:hypothetical protein
VFLSGLGQPHTEGVEPSSGYGADLSTFVAANYVVCDTDVIERLRWWKME